MEKRLKGIILSNGKPAIEYVMSLPECHREVATQAILNCLEKGYPLNNMEITSKARELHIALRLPGIVWRVLHKPTTKANLLLLCYRWWNNRSVSSP